MYAFQHEMGTLYNHKKLTAFQLKITQSNLYLVQSIMGNIYRKGFATALFGKDHEKTLEYQKADMLAENNVEQVKAIENWINANKFEVTNLYINDSGLIMGEVIHDMESISFNRFIFPTIYVIEPLIILAVLIALFQSFIQIFLTSDTAISPDLQSFYVILALVTILFFSIRRLFGVLRNKF